ncbi:sodium-dependent transporter [Clostridium oceanicum]|uniref:Transporter n=1 Tax=Clostridium oceanicum TaxID=1543 RepID=A0ABN1JP83_9CLOT
MAKEKGREKFSSKIGIFFATLAAAVGLGNIWKFPYLVGENGGGAFLLVYLICVFFLGIPVMISEFYIGRKTKKNVIGAIEKLNPNSKWKIIGYMGIITSYFIMFFYTAVAGWVYSYFFKSLTGKFNNIDLNSAKDVFSSTVASNISPVFWQIIVLIVVSSIILLGVQKGIEKVTKTLMPLLFILIIICGVRALTLPGAREGLNFLLNPDFSKLTATGILIALGLAFFKLAVGLGAMVTYSSYFTEDTNMISNSIKVAFSDTLVSLLAGIAIFPVVFSFNIKPTEGPGLLFMSIPLVFSKIPLGKVLLVIFFLLTAMASTMSILSMIQVQIAYYTEEMNITRKKAVIFNFILVALVGSLATLSADPSSILYNVKILGFTFFDIFDKTSSNVLLPLGGLLIAVFVGYKNKKEDILYELSNKGTLKVEKMVSIYYFIIRYITPIILLVVFLNSIGIIKF